MKASSFIPPVVITSGFILVIVIIWQQEFKHYLPSEDHADLPINSVIDLDFLESGKPSYIHFFSESCRSSRVNIAHIQRIIARYEKEVEFYIINRSDVAGESIRIKYDIPPLVQIIDDKSGDISRSLQVHSLPYALIATSERNLFFGGNYNNKNGLCGASDIIWSSPSVALKFLIKHEKPPLFPQHQLAFVGCSLE